MKRLSIVASFLATSLTAAAALACGAPFGAGVNVDPRQDIIVSYKNGIETYVFQPRFCGVVADFGLILPIPDKLSVVPTLAAASAFAQVDAMSKPEEVYRTLCRGRGVGAMDAGVPNSGGTNPGATVVSQGKVGFLDYAQIKADSEAAITDWLKANGYPYDTQAAATFTYYVQKGWYFLAFKISTGAVGTTSVCKDLGPVMVSFPSVVPVVPTRMAGARARDTSGSLSYGSGFSWRIFAITSGESQVEFATGGYMVRELGYSGLVPAADVPALAGLAVEGDRLTKLTIGFNYGSVEADVGLRVGTGTNYRAIKYFDTYVDCLDGGIDVSPVKVDARPVDTLPAVGVDAGMDAGMEGGVDAGVDAGLNAKVDAVSMGTLDSAAIADARPTVAVDAKGTDPEKKKGGGCSVSERAPSQGLSGLLFAVGLFLLGRHRARRKA